MLWRAPETELIPLCEREGISQIVWSPLAQGVLTGKYRPGEPPPADSRAASESMSGFIDRSSRRPVLEAVAATAPDRRGRRADDGPARPRLGAAPAQRRLRDRRRLRPEQVRRQRLRRGIELDADTLAAIDAALDAVIVR